MCEAGAFSCIHTPKERPSLRPFWKLTDRATQYALSPSCNLPLHPYLTPSHLPDLSSNNPSSRKSSLACSSWSLVPPWGSHSSLSSPPSPAQPSPLWVSLSGDGGSPLHWAGSPRRQAAVVAAVSPAQGQTQRKSSGG